VKELTGTHCPEFRLRSLVSSRRISKYSQMRVTIKAKPPYHSVYFGAPARAPLSIRSKSNTRLSGSGTIGIGFSVVVVIVAAPPAPR